MNLPMLIIYFIICYSPVLIIAPMMPYISAKTLSFGISIPEEVFDNKEIKNIRGNYRNRVILFGIIIALAAFILALAETPEVSLRIITAGVFADILMVFLLFLQAHKKTKQLKENSNWPLDKSFIITTDTGISRRRRLVSPFWFLMYILIIVGTAAIGITMYDKMPAQIPVHWNISGEVDRMADKSYWVIFFRPAMQSGITLVMFLIYSSIGKLRMQAIGSNPNKKLEQKRIFSYGLSAFIVFSGLALTVTYTVSQIAIAYSIHQGPFLILLPLYVSLLIVIAAIVMSIKIGQGGNRVVIVMEEQKNYSKTKVVNRDDDSYWKMGMFYFNPQDPSFLVEKRFGVGLTINFAKPWAWIVIGMILVLPIIELIISIRK